MADREGPATLLDVAREAGVSLATASRALNGSARKVREDLRVRVLEAAAQLDYTANAQAQAVARGRSGVVGLLVHDIADPYFSSIAAGVMRAAEEHGLLVTLASTGRDHERELSYLASLRGQRACAVILAGSREDRPEGEEQLAQALSSFEAGGGRVAMISQDRLPVDTVVPENRDGARELAERLLELGHRSFAVLGGPPDLLTAQDRVAGFTGALARAGVEVDGGVLHGSFTRDGGYASMAELLDRGTRARCVFAVNDVMAVGAMSALRDRGIAMPGQVCVAGFDDIVTSRDVTPSLTTVRLPLEAVGASALDLVLRPSSPAPRVQRVRGEVLLRASTALT